jgi:chemotaxis protein MotA
MAKFSTLLGILISVGLVVWAIVTGGDITSFIHTQSIAIVLGGTVGTTLMVFNLTTLKSLVKIFKIAFFKTEGDRVEELYKVLHLSNLARKKGGVLGISAEIEALEDPFMSKGFNLILDNINPEDVKSIMSHEIDSTIQRHQNGQDILGFMASAAPAFGMIGTLIGLVGMLKSLSDPDMIGPQMAVALLTTLYGAFLANVIFIPLQKKLEKVTEEEIAIKEGLLDGMLAVQSAQQTIVIEEKLKSYLNSTLKHKLEERIEAGKKEA